MAGMLSDRRIGILAASGCDEAEFVAIHEALSAAGAEVAVVSTKKEALRAWRNKEWGADFAVDVAVVDADADSFDGLILPGGLIAADTLRSDEAAILLVRGVLDRDRPVATIGHAAWVLIEAGAVRDREVTGIEAIRTDIDNAGGRWVDRVTASNLITGRHRDDLPEVLARFILEAARQ